MDNVLPNHGDIIEITKEVIVGERRRFKRRGYDTYLVREVKTFRAIVKLGRFKDCAYVLYYTTPTKESYNSYFYASGRHRDVPERLNLSLDNILRIDTQYKIIGTDESLLIEGYI